MLLSSRPDEALRCFALRAWSVASPAQSLGSGTKMKVFVGVVVAAWRSGQHIGQPARPGLIKMIGGVTRWPAGQARLTAALPRPWPAAPLAELDQPHRQALPAAARHCRLPDLSRLGLPWVGMATAAQIPAQPAQPPLCRGAIVALRTNAHRKSRAPAMVPMAPMAPLLRKDSLIL